MRRPPAWGVDWRAARNAPFAAYIRPARRGERGLWRVGLGLSLIVACAAVAAAVALNLTALAGFDDPTLRLFMTLGVIATAWPAMALIAPGLHGRSLSSVVGPSLARAALDALAGALAVAFVAALLLAQAAFSPEIELLRPNAPRPNWAALALIGAALVALQASAEELTFRGYLMQQLAARCRSALVWAVIPSLIFGALHYAPAPGDQPAYALSVAASAALFGLFCAYLTWRTGGLGAAAGVHIANNLFAFLLLDQSGDPTLGALALFTGPLPTPMALILGELVYLGLLVAVIEAPFSPIHKILRIPRWS